MKKLLSVLLAISLVLVFAACDNKGTVSDTNAPSDAFVKPENYSTVVTVTINPQFNLYLNDANEVLAVEPVNDDAKSVAEQVKTIKGTLEAVINNIVTASSQNGFVKENADIKFEITEKNTDSVNNDVVLNSAKQAAEKVAEDLNISVNVQVSVAINITNNNTTINNNTVNNIIINNNSSEHHHVFTEATCVAPKKCTCGATEGKALGHNYTYGECTRCKAKDPNYKTYTRILSKNGEWTANYIDNDGCLYMVSFTLYGSADNLGFGYGIGDPLSSLPPEAQEDIRKHKDEEGYKDSYIIFEGKEFYCGRGFGDGIGPVQEFGNSVTVNDLNGAVLSLERTGEDTLTVKESPATFSDLDKIPVGTKFTFKAN